MEPTAEVSLPVRLYLVMLGRAMVTMMMMIDITMRSSISVKPCSERRSAELRRMVLILGSVWLTV